MIYGLILMLGIGMAGCDNDYAEPPVPQPDGGVIGIGTWDDPMTAYQVLQGFVNDSIAEPWACGYIVGYCNTNVSNTLSAASAVLKGEGCTVPTNMLITWKNPADLTPGDSITWEDCATVQLPNTDVRKALNLKDHPDNFGKLVTLRGTTGSKYCGAYGVRSVSDFEWGDKGKDLPPVELQPLPYLWEGWNSSLDLNYYKNSGWRVLTVEGNLLGWGIAQLANGNCMTASAYSGTISGGPYEAWLQSPAVDIDKSMLKNVSFKMRSSYYSPDSSMEVWLIADDKPVRRLDANIPVAPENGFSEWTSSLIDLSDVSGVIRIGWLYKTQKGGRECTAYNLDDVNIGGAPEVIYAGLDAGAATIDWTVDNIKLGGLEYIWSWYERNGAHYLYGTAYANGSFEALSYAISPEIDLTGKTDVSAQFEHAANYQRNIRQLCGFMVREVGQTEWTQIAIPNWPAAGTWNFASSGQISLADFEGKKIQVAFKYESTKQNADSWEIRNFQITGKSK